MEGAWGFSARDLAHYPIVGEMTILPPAALLLEIGRWLSIFDQTAKPFGENLEFSTLSSIPRNEEFHVDSFSLFAESPFPGST